MHRRRTEALPENTQYRQIFKLLIPYVWRYKWRALLALLLLISAKIANVGVPIILKDVVDSLDARQAVLVVPAFLLLAYGTLRFLTVLFGELRDVVFARVIQSTMRSIALEVFSHLHRLSLRFHLDRQTGGLSRDIERGVSGIRFLMNFMLFNILPTLFEIGLVVAILLHRFDARFGLVVVVTLSIYIGLTLLITEWRMGFRRKMNQMDSKANTSAIDSLINYETVKYFNNEEYELNRYDISMQQWEKAAVRSTTSLSLLNSLQGLVIAMGVTVMMLMAADEVSKGRMTVGDLVMVNAFLLQLFIPLNFLGFVYREIRHSLADMERMFNLLKTPAEVEDRDDVDDLVLSQASVSFENVCFSYDKRRQVLKAVTFEIPAGKTVAVVGHSGAGKSTLSRLLYRFYDVTDGAILIDKQDIRDVSQRSVRSAIGVVPQDTVLFNDSIFFNIAYGRPDASREEVIQAAKHAHIHEFIETLPDAYETMVGERGLKLSGGEKQRVAIARTILKAPAILVFDEATSALDSATEKNIQAELEAISANTTTLIIAHRLSTVHHADQILVMENGQIVERGRHAELLARGGIYSHMWALQKEGKIRRGV
ncbi:putative multidrug export ATP-binding/permease protein [bacterium BMS3Bbin11]|nr:putative multidrug export ATP-binding/permease protein [bacterium BMS3Abin11]GBE46807.1 putative multidrug export ATP-binding/permease protein [bacterium BMS3Bbin11]GMT39560.1 MAG: ABC transporter ATP-binding protein [bacterium]HDH07882.1 ABC transporter ATP-binding protein/permease [Gammaproteobacteria bacterium]HDH15881.1 ABC transporter ATP-binding protein/permease [Gammaproteobacteria bacterium]